MLPWIIYQCSVEILCGYFWMKSFMRTAVPVIWWMFCALFQFPMAPWEMVNPAIYPVKTSSVGLCLLSAPANLLLFLQWPQFSRSLGLACSSSTLICNMDKLVDSIFACGIRLPNFVQLTLCVHYNSRQVIEKIFCVTLDYLTYCSLQSGFNVQSYDPPSW